MEKFLGIILIIGGLLVGGVLFWLMNLYAAEGLLSIGLAFIAGLAGFLLLVLPQWLLGVYLLRT